MGARADAPGTAAEDAERFRADAEAARAEAARLAEQIAELETVDAARAAWFTHTAISQDNADRSRTELGARGVDIDRPDDRTTGPDWLAEHRAEAGRRERDQPITEADLLPDDYDDRPSQREEPARDEPSRSDLPEAVERPVSVGRDPRPS